MTELFSVEWMESFAERWNQDPYLAQALSEIQFDSVIGYGFKHEEHPTGVVRVKQGKVILVETYQSQVLDWDLRASPDHWQAWIKRGVSFSALSAAYASKKLQFRVGDIALLLKNPVLAEAFLQAFTVMGQVER
ncbi:MAG: SCP-2 sterol transfer family protein [Oculatellaceae cyanobacterium Prado106]|jgi:hypothetical protein|nr:SCP-2 sterol transfer family protein [Oculatellaceae cyanobacterium Prado106]